MLLHPEVYTLSFNSSVDYTFYLQSFKFDDINRIEKSRIDAGGKGLNVARMLRVFGYPCQAITFLGGENGRILKNLLETENILFKYIPIKGNIRGIFNFIAGEKVLRINEKGPLISPKEQDAFLKMVYSLNLSAGNIVSISGSVPPGIKKTAYRDIIKRAREKGGTVVFDADGKLLADGIKAKPHIIKPNLWELSRAAGIKIKSIKQLKSVLSSLISGGIQTVLVTNGKKGAILFSETHFLYGKPPVVKTVSAVGCGDTFLAGFIYGYSRNKPPEESLRWAVASGAAKVLKEGTSIPAKKDVSALLKQVRITDASGKDALSFF
ncbi:MAG: 1-phosphofructokinase family hexose kinase [Elusimicrobia bacterium]|nr:1-phosphofructokinase family hexose kinase [Elusimicrobiota bacterium]